MAKVLICYEPGDDRPSAYYYGGDTFGNPVPGVDEDAALRLAEEVHRTVHGHVTFHVDHPTPHTMHHGEVMDHIARHKAK